MNKTVPYKIVKNLNELNELISHCITTGYCCSDFETTSLKYFNEWEHPTVLGVSFQPGSAWIIPLYHDESPFKDNYKKVLRIFGKKVIENRDIIKIAWNLKFEAKWFMRYDILYFGRRYDAMLAKYLLDEERPHGLKETTDKYLPEFSGYALKGEDPNRWKKYTLTELSQYCAIDCHCTFMLYLFFEPKLMKIGNFYQLFRNLLMSASSVLAESEYRGMLVDREYLESLVNKYSQKINELQESLYKMKPVIRYNKLYIKQKRKLYIRELNNRLEEEDLSERQIATIKNKIASLLKNIPTNKKEEKIFEKLNFKSPKQLEDFLFVSEYGLELNPIKKTDSGAFSTDEETLSKLKSEDEYGFIENLLELRGLEKLYSTYIVGILQELPDNNRLHTTYLIHGTTTGRLSSSSPNMQNIPRVTTNADIKKMFVPPPGYMLLEMDYAQAELRVVAEISNDTNMIEMFKNNYSVHVATAARMAKMPYEELYPMTKDENHPQHDWATKMKKKAKCYSPNTEVLTPGGWVKLIDYQGELVMQCEPQAGTCSFIEPLNWGTVESGENYLYEDRNISLDVTSDHWQPFITRNNKYVREKFSDLVGKRGYMISSVNTTHKPIIDDLIVRFIAMFTADGNVNYQGAIRFGFKKEKKISRCKAILDKMGIKYTLRERIDVTHFRIPPQDFFGVVFYYVNKDKQLSWQCLKDFDGRIYLDEAKYWDATFDERWSKDTSRFFSREEQTIDVMQAMGSIWGIRCVKHVNKNGISFRLSYNPNGCTKSRVNLRNTLKYVGMKTMYGISVPSENLLIRNNGKVCCSGNTYNFGILYGQGPEKLAETIAAATKSKPNVPEAKQGIEDWFKAFPGVKKWIKKQERLAKEQGYVKSMFGRKRRLHEIDSGNKFKIAEALRQAVNTPIQSAASDFTLLSSIIVREHCMDGTLPAYMRPQAYTVHDSIGYYIKPEDAEWIIPKLIEIAASPDTHKWFGFKMKKVNMKVSVEGGKSWGEYHEYKKGMNYVDIINSK